MKWINPRQQTLKLKDLLYQQMVQGCSPHALALTCALGTTIACLPILGVTTILLVLLGYIFKLNQALLQTINYAMTPVHLLLLPVFFSAGHTFSSTQIPSLNPRIFMHELFHNTEVFFSRYGYAVLLAIAAWALVAPVIGTLVYLVTRSGFKKARLNLGQNKDRKESP